MATNGVYKTGDFSKLQKDNPGGFIEGGTFYASQSAFDSSRKPTSQEQVTPYLNGLQNSLLSGFNTPATRTSSTEGVYKSGDFAQLQRDNPSGFVEGGVFYASQKAFDNSQGGNTSTTPSTSSSILEQLHGGQKAPELINRVETQKQMMADAGVSEIEQSLNTVKDQIRMEQDLIRKARGIEEGKPVPMGVIQGRISEQERVANTRIDELGREQSRLTDELNTKYNIINNTMNLMGLDYQDAVAAYDSNYRQNLDVYNVISGIRRDEQNALQHQQSVASANLTTLMNMVTSGNLDYSSLGEDQQLMITKLEMQAGIPLGTMANVQMNLKDSIVFNTSSNGITQIGIRQADGTIRVMVHQPRQKLILLLDIHLHK